MLWDFVDDVCCLGYIFHTDEESLSCEFRVNTVSRSSDAETTQMHPAPTLPSLVTVTLAVGDGEGIFIHAPCLVD